MFENTLLTRWPTVVRMTITTTAMGTRIRALHWHLPSTDDLRSRCETDLQVAEMGRDNGRYHVAVDDVCAEARVSKGAFYGYFESKQDRYALRRREENASFRPLVPWPILEAHKRLNSPVRLPSFMTATDVETLPS
jgi:hypothetical protein